jgi:hypothetical protein
MAFGTLPVIVFVWPVTRVAAHAIVLAGVVELGIAPVAGVVAVGALAAEVVVGFVS